MQDGILPYSFKKIFDWGLRPQIPNSKNTQIIKLSDKQRIKTKRRTPHENRYSRRGPLGRSRYGSSMADRARH